MKDKKIVIVSMNGMRSVGGVERVVYYLNQIFSEKYEVKIIERKKTFGKFDLIIWPVLFSFKLIFIRNKIVISQSWQSFLYPVDFSIHHGTTRGFTNKVKEAKSFGSTIISLFEKISAYTAKKILSVSENCKNELVKLYKTNQKKIIVLNNFVDENQFYPIKNNKTVHSLNLTLLFSGRLENRKGFQELKVLSDYIENLEGVRLIIACPNSENSQYFKNKKNTILHIGLKFNQMNEFYNKGNVFVFPTKYEGFSMATLEALSCGCCVLGTSAAIPQELSNYDFAVVPKDFTPETIVSEAEKLMNDFKDRKDEIHKTITENFGYAQYKQKLMTIIESRV